MKRWRNHRESGSTLLLVVCLAFMIAAAAMIVICFLMMMNQQKRNESKAEEQALTMSMTINGQDWVGEINNLTGFSREMVFTSRQQADVVAKQAPQFTPLAMQLLDEARLSAQLVEADKKTLLNDFDQSIKAGIKIANDAHRRQPGLILPWVATGKAEVQTVDIGYLEGVPSNVYGPIAIPALKEFDVSQNFLNAKSGLYNANIDARLPMPDDDLHFQFSSLPAPVKDTIAPARLASNEEFRSLVTVRENKTSDLAKCRQLPSAVQVQSTMNMASSAGNNKAEAPVKVTATAACSGGTLKLP